MWLLTRVPLVTCVWKYVIFLLCCNGLGIGKCVISSFHRGRKFCRLALMLIGAGRTLFQCDS